MELHRNNSSLSGALITLLLIFLLTGCDDDPVICSASQEEAVVTQLAETLDNCGCQISLIRGIFLDNTVYYLRNTAPNCSSMLDLTLYNCNGEVVKTPLILTQENFDQLVKLDEVLYRCNN